MIGIIDYRAGTLTSVSRALAFLNEPSVITDDRELLDQASHIIFPGVGTAGTAMANLKEKGLADSLRKWVQAKKPLLGICLGSQIIFDKSEEAETQCLGIIPGVVRRFPPELHDGTQRLKIPHMGWNSVAFTKSPPVFAGLPEEAEFYFVHSFYADPADAADAAGWTEYGIKFCSAVARGSLVAVQFHPEKSGRPGLMLLKNFCRWNGKNDE